MKNRQNAFFTERKGAKRLALAVFALLLVIASVIAVCLILNQNGDPNGDPKRDPEQIRTEALAMLDSREGEYDETRIVLQNTTHSEAKAMAEMLGASLRITSDGKFAALTLPEGVTIKDIYLDDNNLTYIEDMAPDFFAASADIETVDEIPSLREPVRPQYTVTDSGYQNQNYLDYLNMGKVWNTTKGNGITVAVIDTGIDTDHPEFAGKISEYSYNATEDKIVKDYLLEDGSYDWSLVEDEQGHGTAVSGVIAASMNGEGVVGIAPEVTIIVIKAECDENGNFYRSSDLVFGLYYAIERDVDVVNMSFGSYGANPFASATKLAVDSDIICVAAAGNDSTTQLCYPAADENVIGVGALADGSWELAEYSNYGENSDIVAPGTTYTTLMGGKYGIMNGTSLACPTVVGGMALYLSRNNYATFDSVLENLYASTYDLGDLGDDWYFGFGAFDINALVLEERGKVTFDVMTDELEDFDQLFVRYHTLQDMPVPERVYSIFDGWYYDIDCTEPLNLYRDEFSADLTLYAKWTNEDDGVPYTYVELDDGTIEIRSYTGHRRYITMPEYIDGKVVSSIGRGAFEGERNFRIVDLPAQLKKIGDRAFYGCVGLTIAEIPDTVTYIGSEAFYDNARLQGVSFGAESQLTAIGDFAFGNCTSLRRFEIPESVTSLNGSAFVGSTSITQFGIIGESNTFIVIDGVLFNRPETELVAYPAGRSGSYDIPASVKNIGTYAFAFSKLNAIDLSGVENIKDYAFTNSRLTSLVIADSVKGLGQAAFKNNSYLRSLTIGKGLTSISAEAFAYSAITSLNIPKGIMQIQGSAFAYNTSLSSLTFEEGSALVSIGGSAFLGSALENITFPNSLVQIGGGAFANSFYLTSVDFAEGSSLQVIADGAFSECISLASFEFPENLRTIGAKAFYYTALTEVNLPASLATLGVGAFAECSVLQNIFVDDNNTSYIDIDGVVYNPDKTVIVEYPVGNPRTSYTVEPTVTEIGVGAFWGSHILTSVSLPEGLMTVGEQAFYNCTEITRYSLPKSLTYIERYAFSYNTSLSSIAIPDNVYQISNYAFAYDYNCTSISFSSNAKLPRISYAAFAYTGITSFTVPASVSTMAQEAFIGSTNLRYLYFAENSKLESISAYMLKGADNLRGITFRSGTKLTSIQAHGFEGMKNLQYIDFADAKLTNVDNFAFRYCESLQSLTLPEGVDYIGRYAFYGCKALRSLTLPATVDYIGEFAFVHDTELNVYFAADELPLTLAENWDYGIKGYYVGVTNVVETDEWDYAEKTDGTVAIIKYKGAEKSLDLTAFPYGAVSVIGGSAFEYSKVESITLPETLKEIHRNAFGYSKLKSVTLPDSLVSIGQNAFAWSNIETVAFGTSPALKKIEQYAFAGTKKLGAVTLPSSLDILGKYIFSESNITFCDISSLNITEIPEGMFYKSKLESITFPDTITKVCDNAFRDCEALRTVEFGTADFILESNVFYGSGLCEMHIPDNLTYIGEYALVGLESLPAFTVSETHPKYIAIDGIIYSLDAKKLICAPAGKTGEITLPESLEILGFGAFENSKLSKINFHENSNILTFGYRCFYNAAITEVTVPKTVVSFDFYAFAMCKNLTTVHIAEDNNLKGIYEGAFYGCLNLKNIILPDSIVEISDYAFYGCTSLDKLPVSETTELKGIYDYAFAYMHFDELTLPDTLIDIGNYAFLGSKFESVTIESGENTETLIIGIGAFEQNNSLKEITLPFIGASFEDYDITWFGYIFGAGAYEANSAYVPESLKTVTINGDISFVGTGGFNGLTTLEEVNLPASVTGLYDYAFNGTTAKYELKSEVTLYQWYEWSRETVIATDATSSYFGKGISGYLALADSVTSIDYRAFYGCTSLTSITIPEGVTSIGEEAFNGCTSLTSITIPDSVTSIGDYAFLGCSGLASITIPDGVTSIGNYAFDDCTSLASVTFGDNSQLTSIGNYAFSSCSGLTSITIPDSVTSIGEWAFYGCSSLTSITIPESVTSIVERAFLGCSGLASITIPEGVTSIGEEAFNGCTSLTSITIPDSVTSIGEWAFYGCWNLYEVVNNSDFVFSFGSSDYGYIAYNARIIIDAEGNKSFKDDENFITIDTPDGFRFSYYNGEYQLIAYLGNEETITLPASINENPYTIYRFVCSAKKIIIPEGITEIQDFTFQSIGTVESISFPNSVVSIGDHAFDNGCRNLQEVKFADDSQLQYIGHAAFYGCRNLSEIKLPDSLSHIGSQAFEYCKLEKIYLGKNLQTIFPSAFSNTNIKVMEVSEENEHLKFENGLLYDNEIIYVMDYVTDVYIPADVSLGQTSFSGKGNIISVTFDPNANIFSIPPEAFSVCSNLKEIIIPEQVTSIGWNAFNGCSNLENIIIPDSVTHIGSSAFSRCTSLTSVTIPDSVTGIDKKAFAGCSNLVNVEIGSGLKSLGEDLFRDSPVENISVNEGNKNIIVENGIGYNADKTEIMFVMNTVTDVVIPSTVIDIGSSFYGRTNLQTVSFEEGSKITSIASHAFQGCTSLQSITIPDGVTSIGAQAFYRCTSLASITIPDSITSIGNNIEFQDCSSLYEVINNSDLTITLGGSDNGYVAYYARVLVDKEGNRTYRSGYDGFTYVDTTDGFRFSYYNGKYQLIAYLGEEETVTLPTDINGSEYEIYYFRGAKNVIIPDGVTSIGNYAFDDCTSLESITIPSGVQSIGYEAFRSCTNLTEVNFGENSQLTSIGNYAFDDCTSLQSITIPDSVLSLGSYAFTGTAYYNDPANWKNGTLFIGEHLIDVYENATVVEAKGGAIAYDAFSGCYKLKNLTIGGNHKSLLSSLTNLETLVLTELPFYDWENGNYGCIYEYFGWDTSNIPITLKNIIIKDGCDVTRSDLFYGISGVNIYVESDQYSVQHWDQDYKGWNNGNNVFYGNSWISADFLDEDGSTLGYGYYLTSSVVRQPYVENKVNGDITRVFVGWDTNGDGLVDTIPATSASNIVATAVYQDHRLGTPETKEPTCTEDGYIKTVCTECGEVIEYKHLPKTGHTSGGIVETIAPTCAAEGYELHNCSVCGEDYQLNFTSKAEHVFNNWTVDIAPTCENDGTRHHTCAICNTREDAVIPKTNHAYSAVTTKIATCEHEGEVRYTCANCGDRFTAKVDALPHTYEKHYASKSFIRWLIELLLNIFCGYEGDNAFYYKCSDCGRIMTAEEAATFSTSGVGTIDCIHETLGGWAVEKPESCLDVGVEARRCTSCNEIVELRTFGIAHGHTEVADRAVAPTCTETGLTYGKHCSECGEILVAQTVVSALGHDTVHHDAKAPTCINIGWEAYDTCTRCNYTTYTEIEATGHTSSDWITDNNATCLLTGLKHKECTVCGVTLVTEVIAATGHTASDWLTDSNATCTIAGSKHKECTVCEATLETAVIPTIAHTEATDSAVAPTCTATGLTAGKHCSVCGKVTVAQTVVPATGHTSSTWIIDSNATCTVTGAKHKECTVCHAVLETAVISTIAHTEATDSAVAPTCTSTGLTAGKHCSVCGKVTVAQTVVPATGHTASTWITDSNATCTVAGAKHKECTVCHAVLETAVIAATGHTYTSSVTAPTCTAKGYTTYTCSCGDSYVTNYTDKVAHTASTWITDSNATCTVAGAKHKECTVCEATLETAVIPTIAHTEATDNAVAPTCTATGLTAGKHCSVCGKVTVAQTVVAATGHTASTWITDSNATCTVAGSKHKECTVCEATLETAVIPTIAHTEAVDSAVDATCTATGLTAGKHCSVCGKVTVAQTVVPATGHTASEWIIDSNATCTIAGAKHKECTVCKATLETAVIPTIAHTEATDSAVAPTCTATGLTAGKHCSVCGKVIVAQTVVDALGHTYTSSVTAPTCTAKGYTTYTCSCGDSYVANYTDKIAHTSSEWLTDSNATCTVAGTKHKECTVCEATLETAVIPTIAHTEAVDSAVNATCTSTGLTAGKHCSVCGKVTVAQTVVDALGHTYTTSVTAPTCTAKGYTTYTCSCGDSYVANYTDKIAHTGSTWITDSNATCTIAGSKHKECTVCHAVLETAVIAATGHTYTSSVTAPTCTAKGYTTYTCSCGDSYVSNYTDKIAHTASEWIIDSNATCTIAGSKHKECTVCEATLETAVIPTIAHTEATDNAVTPTCTATGLTAGKHCSVCGKVTVAQTVVPATGHTASTWITDSNATCTVAGTKHKECTVCEATLETAVIPTIAHKESTDSAAAPTCTATGLKAGKHCSVCGKVTVAQTVVAATRHNYTSSVTEPTCTAKGYTTYTCSCGDSYVANYTNKIAHIAIPWITDSNATCTVAGVKHRLCIVCEATVVTEVIAATGHTASEWIIDSAATCTVAGAKHKECTVCHAVLETAVIPTIAHTESTDSAVAPTCTATGLTQGSHCSVCGKVTVAQTVVPATGHTYTTSVTAPTCTAKGYTTYTCSCGDSYVSNYTDKLNHTASEWIIDSNATCTIAGTKHKECTVCEATLETAVIPTIAHTEAVDSAVDATCTSTGLTQGSHCSVCGKVTVAQTVVVALGHNMVHHDAKAPDCTNIGWSAYDVCSRCALSTYVELSPAGHKLVNHGAKVPTCTESGWGAYVTCEKCDYSTYSELGAAHIHSAEWSSDGDQHWNECICGDKANNAAHTLGENGKCTVCGYEKPATAPTGGDNTQEAPEDGLSGGAIAGIAVASTAVVGVGGFSLVWFVIKKKS